MLDVVVAHLSENGKNDMCRCAKTDVTRVGQVTIVSESLINILKLSNDVKSVLTH